MTDAESPDWRRRGLCGDPEVDPDMWFANDIGTRRFAQHLCREHCPVLANCRSMAEKFPFRGVVVGGIIFSDKEGVRLADVTAPVPCYLCRKEQPPESTPDADTPPADDPFARFRTNFVELVPAWR